MNDPGSQALVHPPTSPTWPASRAAPSPTGAIATSTSPSPSQVAATSPLFDRREVDAWLATGYSLGRNAEEESLWRALSGMRDAGFGTEELVDMALTVARARRLSDDSASAMPPWRQIVDDSPQIGSRCPADCGGRRVSS